MANPSIPEYKNLFGEPQEFKNPRRALRGFDSDGNPTVTCRECHHTGPVDDFKRGTSQPECVESICIQCNRQQKINWNTKNPDHEKMRNLRNRIYWYQNEPGGVKRCADCMEEKKAVEFAKDVSKNDGLRSYCKECWNARCKERGYSYRKHWRSLLESQGYRCNPAGIKPGCGIPLEDDFEVDHIMPRSKGGSDEIENLQVLCVRCNRRWSARLPNQGE